MTNLRKVMSSNRRKFKLDSTESNLQLFKTSRIAYFHEIRAAKQKCWRDFFENARKKEVFNEYKYTKPRVIEKLPPILHANKLHVSFSDKVDAFVTATYPKNPGQ